MSQTRRRLISGLGVVLAGAALPAFGQSSGVKAPRIGVLFAARKEQMASQIDALRSGMRELNYEDGRNVRLEFLTAEGANDRLPSLAAELVRSKVDLIVAFGTPASLAAKRATSAIPIVMVAVGDPVGTGLVSSLARPGGNVTGMSLVSPQIVAKRLELLKEAQPRLRRIAVLFNPSNPAQKISLRTANAAAERLKVELRAFEARNLDEIVGAFSAMAAERMEGVVLANDVVFSTNASAIVALANEHRLPSVGFGEIARAGALIGFGSWTDVYRLSATYIDRILKGAKPADLPVEQPSKFEVVLNARTAKTLGVVIAPSFYSRADRVIE